MQLSVAYTFAPGLIESLAKYPEVNEIYGKMDSDIIGGGRSSYTLQRISKNDIINSVNTAHKHNIRFNYLMNAATLNGLEQTKTGQKKIRSLLDFLSDIHVDNITVSSPYLLRLIKYNYPHFKVRIGVFAVIDSPEKALQWQDIGADTLCLSAIACNRHFTLLKEIRRAVSCGLQLIANANCLLNCVYELTHMNMLSQSSRKGDKLKGFCLDYCFLNCSSKKLRDPTNFIRSTWIRPEDLRYYEEIGYNNFKLVERSCPKELLLQRVKAYANRSFSGNLLEIVGTVAQIKKEQGVSFLQRLKMMRYFLKLGRVKWKSLFLMKKYSESVILHEFDKENACVYIDNKALDGFIERIIKEKCLTRNCNECGFCNDVAMKTVTIKKEFKKNVLEMADVLEKGLHSGSLWL